VGKDFYEAVKHEADLYRRSKDEVRVIEVRTAWAEFEPVTLPDTEAESYPDKAKFIARVKAAAAGLLKARYAYFKDYYGKILLEDPADIDANLNLGILTAQNGEAGAAEKYFGEVLEKDLHNAAALNNLGNLALEQNKYDEARKYYFDAAKADPYDAEIWLNLARLSDKAGKKDDVKAFADRAAKIDPAAKAAGDKLLK
jgi:Tfp pilus assembly protein PilF